MSPLPRQTVWMRKDISDPFPMKTRPLPFIAALILFAITTTIFAEPPASPRTKYNFNSDWLVKVGDESGAEAAAFADTDWKKVTLPYAWNEDSAFKVSIDELPTGIAWYRKHFKLPPDAAGKKVFLEFEGIRQGGEFYLNGEWIGRQRERRDGLRLRHHATK